MDAFRIEGGPQLTGDVQISGSKNASLPLMAAALLSDQPLELADVPDLRDIRNMMGLLSELGCENGRGSDGVLRLQSDHGSQVSSHARYEIVRTMRASICVLGPLLARRGVARVAMPGGCAIGERPVDLHLRGLRALGAEIHLESGDIVARADRLQGTTIFLGGPFGSTVLGTANVMSAATLAHGVTVIESAACEPEIVELAHLLNAMGAHIQGAGTPRVTIEGVRELKGASHRVMPDRIEAGTYVLAAVVARGHLRILNCPSDALLSLVDRLAAAEVAITVNNGDANGSSHYANGSTIGQRATIEVNARDSKRPKSIQVTTQPFPGFPTDLQAQMMALLSMADGISVVTEKIYPDRFLHVAEMSRMGAQLIRQGATVVVQGVHRLIGAPVMASDLRASAGLVLAGLAAEGETKISRVYHLDRGYESMEKKLAAVGAKIERIDERESD